MKASALTRLLGAAVVTLAVSAAYAQPASASGGGDDRHGSSSGNQVYEATNDAAGNAVQVFDQASDGTLTVGPLVPTGGLGTGNSLASQGGVARDGRTLLVVNGGDNPVSPFVIPPHGLSLPGVEPAGGP